MNSEDLAAGNATPIAFPDMATADDSSSTVVEPSLATRPRASHRTRVGGAAIAIAFVAVLLIGIIAGYWFPHPAVGQTAVETYVAFAFAPASGTIGSGTGSDPTLAQTSAESDCRHQGGDVDCQGVVWWNNGAASIAVNSSAPWQWDAGGNEDTTLPNLVADSRVRCSSCEVVLRLSVAGTIPFNFSPIAAAHGNLQYHKPMGGGTASDPSVLSVTSDDPAVYPIKTGRVVYSGVVGASVDASPYGYQVVVYHEDGVYSIYQHLAADGIAAQGEMVTPQTRIGTVSSTGCKGDSCSPNLLLWVGSGPSDPIADGNTAIDGMKEWRTLRTPWQSFAESNS